jgi:hypothetical protein
VQHLVTVRAYWPEVFDRVNLIVVRYRRYRNDVMNMNEALSQNTVHCRKVDTAHDANGTIKSDACRSRPGASLIGVCDDSSPAALRVGFGRQRFVPASALPSYCQIRFGLRRRAPLRKQGLQTWRCPADSIEARLRSYCVDGKSGRVRSHRQTKRTIPWMPTFEAQRSSAAELRKLCRIVRGFSHGRGRACFAIPHLIM